MVVLIAGPPGAGKTTRARELASVHGLTVFDRDDEQWASEQQFRLSLMRCLDIEARAVVIRACATRSAWQRMVSLIQPTTTELISPGPEVCKQRIRHDHREYGSGTWQRQPARLAGVGTWYREHAADPWQPERVTLAPSKRWSTA